MGIPARAVERVAAIALKAQLGDPRRSLRFSGIVQAMARAPMDMFPEQARSPAALAGLYRFMSNDAVTYDKVLEPFCAAAAERAVLFDTTLIIHDTTDAVFAGEKP